MTRQRRKRRAGARGTSTIETLILVGILSLGVAASMVAAGERLLTDYRQTKKILASPLP